MAAITTAAVAGVATAGSIYAADQQREAQEDAAKDAIAASERAQARSEELSSEAMAQAARYLSPYLGSSEASLGELRSQLGIAPTRDELASSRWTVDRLAGRGIGSGTTEVADYVPGRDDIRPLSTDTVTDTSLYGEPISFGESPFMGRATPQETGGVEGLYGEPLDYGEYATSYIDPAGYINSLSSGYEEFIDNPIYQKMIEEGQRTALSTAATEGLLGSGTLAERLRDVGQGVSTQWFGNYLGQMDALRDINEARRREGAAYGEDRYMTEMAGGERRLENVIALDEARRREAGAYNEARMMAETGIGEERLRLGVGMQEDRLNRAIDVNQQQEVNRRNIEEQRYANYLNLLQGMASPATATNLASLGAGQAANLGQQAIATAASQGQYYRQQGDAKAQYYGDIAGALGNIGSAAIGGMGGFSPSQPPPSTGGTIY